MYVLIPYKFGSASVKELCKDPDFRRLSRKKLPNWLPKPDNTYINWGCTSFPPVAQQWNTEVLNHPTSVSLACNKLYALRAFTRAGVKCPRFTTDIGVAKDWNVPVIARERLNGTGGKDAYYVEDISIYEDDGRFKLFTMYIKKTHEYRVHVVRGNVVCVQQKRKRLIEDEPDFKIRSHHRGWVFCRNNVEEPPKEVYNQSVLAVDTLRLDFGAVDVTYNKFYNTVSVLEVNTAPGLEMSTVKDYIEGFKV